jgi:hypothetical protein
MSSKKEMRHKGSSPQRKKEKGKQVWMPKTRCSHLVPLEVDVSTSLYFASITVIIFQRQRASRVAYPEIVEWSVTFWGPKCLIVGRCDPKSDSEA